MAVFVTTPRPLTQLLLWTTSYTLEYRTRIQLDHHVRKTPDPYEALGTWTNFFVPLQVSLVYVKGSSIQGRVLGFVRMSHHYAQAAGSLLESAFVVHRPAPPPRYYKKLMNLVNRRILVTFLGAHNV